MPKKQPRPTVSKDLHSIIPPRLYFSLEKLCRDALSYGGNHQGVRQSVSSLIGVMRKEAVQIYGHDTPGIFGLCALLERADPFRADPKRLPELDPIQELKRQAHLDEDQVLAAGLVARINRAWGRFLSVAARAYEQKSATRRDRALDPWWVMGE